MRIVPAGPFFLFGLCLAALLLLLPRPSVPAVAPPANPHTHFQQPAQCPRCHLYNGSKPDPLRFSTASIDFCLECHRAEEPVRTHPLKVHPEGGIRGMKVPPEFPLGDGARIICLTCHTAHGPFVSNVRAFPGQRPMMMDAAGGPAYYRSYFLRRSSPADKVFESLCRSCHTTL